MADESRELTNEKSVWLCDLLDLVFGAGMIIAPLVVIVMMIFAKASWGLHLFGIVLFLLSSAVGGMMMNEAWENLMEEKEIT